MIDISKLLEIIKDPDLKIKINDLFVENISLKEKNFTLKKKIEEFNKVEKIKSKLIFENNHYYVQEKEDKTGPFCTKCWDSENKLIRLHNGGSSDGRHFFECPNCKTQANTGEYNSKYPHNQAEDY